MNAVQYKILHMYFRDRVNLLMKTNMQFLDRQIVPPLDTFSISSIFQRKLLARRFSF